MVSPNPLVSIVMPSFNQAFFLKGAIQSVLAQSYANWELIIVDNHSTDGSQAVVKSFTDARISLFSIKNTGVIAKSRNLGIRHSRGEIIAFLDSDDVWHSEKISRCLPKLSDFSMVCHGMLLMKEGREFQKAVWTQDVPPTFERLLYADSFVSTSTVMIKREPLEREAGFSENPNIVSAEDLDLWLRILKAGYSCYILPDQLTYYAVHEGSSSSNLTKHLRACLTVINMHHQETAQGLVAFIKLMRKQAQIFFMQGRRAILTYNRKSLAFYCFIRAIARNPFVLKYWVATCELIFPSKFIKMIENRRRGLLDRWSAHNA